MKDLSTSEMYFAEHFKTDVKKLWNALYNPNGWDPWFTDEMKIDENGDIFFRWFRLTIVLTCSDERV